MQTNRNIPGRGKNTWIHTLSSILSVLLFLIALVILHHKLKQYHLHDIRVEIQQISGFSFLLAVLVTCFDYWILTGYDTLALRYLKQPLGYWKIVVACAES